MRNWGSLMGVFDDSQKLLYQQRGGRSGELRLPVPGRAYSVAPLTCLASSTTFSGFPSHRAICDFSHFRSRNS